MSRQRRFRLLLAWAALCIMPAGRTAAAQPAPFHVYLRPPISYVDVGETAFVRLEVDSTARQFNGYEATIAYPPDLVDFLPPVVEGPLMTGACGNTFTHLSETDSTLTFAHVILCGGIALDGPGLLSTYRFRSLAAGTSRIAITSHPDSTFAYAGVYINPSHPTFPRQVIFHDAWIISPREGLATEESPRAPLRLEPNVPNPFRSSTAIAFELPAGAPVTLEVFDATGRRVWAEPAVLGAGRHLVHWHGAALDASPLPSGTYLFRLGTPSGSASCKLTLLR